MHALTDTPLNVVAGVLSGTSADGIDVALVKPSFEMADDRCAGAGLHTDGGQRRLASLDCLAFTTEPFSPDLERRVRAVLDGREPSLRGIAALHRDLGRAFGAAASRVAQHAGLKLDLVASHGQTVFHHDGDPAIGPATLQLGCGDEISESAGCAVASDFRARDIAAGGEGAPLVGLVDPVLFASAPRPLAILNLGGIANWTILPPVKQVEPALGASAGRSHGTRPPVIAFDVGPAGALLDGISRHRWGSAYDEGGRIAGRGVLDERLLQYLQSHPFMALAPPKSTGRDTFGEAWLGGVLERAAGLSDADLARTAAEFVARSCVEALRRALASSGIGSGFGRSESLHVAVAGGGFHNMAVRGALERALRREWSVDGTDSCGVVTEVCVSTEAYGVSPDAREALAFAALGVRLAVGEASTCLQGPRILGKWSPAP